ncbi:MAG: PEPxxWA-CTERM sorting domain-containing protein [Sphingomicrobium sp.]
MLRKFLIPALVLGSLAVPAQASNVLSNPGFETGTFASWTIANGTPTVSSAQAHSGTYSDAAFAEDQIKQTFGAVATSQITEVSFWALRDGGPFDLYTFFYSDSTSQDFILNAIGASGWNQYNVTSNLAAGKNLVGFGIYGTTSGPTYLDDFVINVGGGVPEPSTWAMMLLGFGAMGVAMRRRRSKALQAA